MTLYLYQAAYTPESVAAQIKEPQDRIKTVTPALEAMGAKILVGGYPFGDYDVLVIFEAPDDTTAASVALAVAAGGATRSAKTTRLLNGQEWIDSLRKAPWVRMLTKALKPVASCCAWRSLPFFSSLAIFCAPARLAPRAATIM